VIHGTTTKVSTGCGNLYVTINNDDLGRPFEVFMQMGKAGGCAMSQLEAIGRLASLALRSGVNVDSIIGQLRGIRCPSPSWEKGGGRIFSCSDAIARVIERRMSEISEKKVQRESEGPQEESPGESQEEKLEQSAGYAASSFQLEGTASAGGEATSTKTRTGSVVGVCPDCGAALRHVEGCQVCTGPCGYSKCG
jgi:ribonucleoside-diphosphate reductase alpha chain